jgi:hypothetical protein
VAGKPHAELEGTAMEVSWPFGYRTKIFMKAVDGNLPGDEMPIQTARISMKKES